MTLFWDRQNQPIEDVIEWAKKYEDAAYRVVAVDSDGQDEPWVSTIWQGLDLAHMLYQDGSTAMIFETAYLVGGRVVDTVLAHDEAWALENHRDFTVKHLGRLPRPEDGHVQTVIANEKKGPSGDAVGH